MGTENNIYERDLSNLACWVLQDLRRPSPNKIDVRMTSLETKDGVSVLMVISTDDDKN
jgi:hypothetical protein